MVVLSALPLWAVCKVVSHPHKLFPQKGQWLEVADCSMLRCEMTKVPLTDKLAKGTLTDSPHKLLGGYTTGVARLKNKNKT